jgi:hypothetical protein
MICPHCQAIAVDEGSSFCTSCGSPLWQAAAAPGAAVPAGGPAGAAPEPAAAAPAASPSAFPASGYQPPGYQAPGYQAPGYQGPGYPGPGAAPARPAGPAFSLDVRRLSGIDQVAGGASLILLITLFLPWYGISALGQTYSASGVSVHGWLVLSLIITVALAGYLVLRAGWDKPPFQLPIAHELLLLIGTGLQLLLTLLAFVAKPAYLSWEFGAWLGLIAAIAACAPVVVPAITSLQQRNQPTPGG